ncbi:MAG: hypothetical protein N3D75_04320 [Candidatus Aenigmarchaeota archaeon]|jgi:hypothetical protein|nr:hypothetical protein [Candidatus Aenigmarchaeota archaeon]
MKFLRDDKSIKNIMLLSFSLSGLVFTGYVIFGLKPSFQEIKDILFLLLGVGIGYVAKGDRNGKKK